VWGWYAVDMFWVVPVLLHNPWINLDTNLGVLVTYEFHWEPDLREYMLYEKPCHFFCCHCLIAWDEDRCFATVMVSNCEYCVVSLQLHISVLMGCLTHLGLAGASWYNTLKLASCHVHRRCPNPLQSPYKVMTSK